MLKKIIFVVLFIIVLCSCSTTISYDQCPIYPKGGIEVGKELSTIPYQGYEHFWNWIAKIDKLRQELELCR